LPCESVMEENVAVLKSSPTRIRSPAVVLDWKDAEKVLVELLAALAVVWTKVICVAVEGCKVKTTEELAPSVAVTVAL